MSRGKISVSNFNNLMKRVLTVSGQKDVVCFDVFDTLIRRKVEPEYVKDLVAQYVVNIEGCKYLDWELVRRIRYDLEIEFGAENEAKGFDNELIYDDLLTRWLALCFEGDINAIHSLVKQRELDLEIAAQILTPGIDEVLRELTSLGKKLFFVSDMYFPSEVIWSFLRAQGVDGYFVNGYVSSDFLEKKATGRLFKRFLSLENLQAERAVFVGDNHHSDVLVPSTMGFDVIHIVDEKERKRRAQLQLSEWATKRDKYWAGRHLELAVNGIPKHICLDSTDDNYNLGLLMAPILVLFVIHIMERSKQSNLERICFLAREGKVFMDMYQTLTKIMGHDYPPATYLYVSRKATYLPSMEELSWKELNRFLAQYRSQSLKSLLQNLSLPAEEFYEYAFEAGITNVEAVIDNPQDDPALNQFLMDPKVQTLFCHYRDLARTMFTDYLAQEGVLGLERVGFVDIGWKGTIQDNIVKTFQENKTFPEVFGFYMGLVDSPNHVSLRSEKEGFFAELQRGDYIQNVIFKNGSVFEMCTTPNHGTTIGYRRGENGIEPVLLSHSQEEKNYRQHFDAVFRALNDYVAEFASSYMLISGEAKDMKWYFMDKMRRYILYPSRSEVRAFLRYSHVESFGVNQVTTYEVKGSILRVIFGGKPRRIVTRFHEWVAKQVWPESALRQSNFPLINFFYDVLSTRHATRR